jgi:hypothetical protein
MQKHQINRLQRQSSNPQHDSYWPPYISSGSSRSLWRPRGPKARANGRRQDDAHRVRAALESDRFQGVPKIDQAAHISNSRRRHPCRKDLSIWLPLVLVFDPFSCPFSVSFDALLVVAFKFSCGKRTTLDDQDSARKLGDAVFWGG